MSPSYMQLILHLLNRNNIFFFLQNVNNMFFLNIYVLHYLELH